MIVAHLVVRDFRNYDAVDVSFGKGLNVIVGPNGAGKTNLVEAIHYLSLARSFRAENDAELIRRGEMSAAIEAEIREGEITRRLKVVLSGEGKTISVNGKKVGRLSELARLVNVIIFEPNDVNLFRDVPKVRRKFLDVALSKQSPTYLEVITRYEKALKERNGILKDEKPDLLHLDAVTEILIELSEPIVRYRTEYAAKINAVFAKIIQAIGGDEASAVIMYHPFIQPLTDFHAEARAAFAEALQDDLRRKVTTVGPQRDDFAVFYNGNDIARFGSQGENRLVALALKLSPYFLVKDKDKRPIIVLDDALSELDEKHQTLLLAFLEKLGQTFITTTHYDKNGASIYEVASHKILRRNAE